ncbi:MAG: FHA domain-containing protein [Chloroflexota bacterium]
MSPTIEVRHPDGRRETVTLTRQRTIVGRSADAHIRIQDTHVSREHCALEIEGDRLYVVDLGGQNGTWAGATKLLPNIREPFPQEVVVHVGPAQLHNVTSGRLTSPEDVESQVYQPEAPLRPAAGAPAPQHSAATVTLQEAHLKLNPGDRGTLQLTVSNQGKIVDHYTLSVQGVPPAWYTVPRAGVELLPRQSGNLSLQLHPPRNSRTTAGVHTLNLAILNHQQQIVAQAEATLEITAYDQLTLSVRPDPYQSRSGGVLTLTVESDGNAQTEYRVDVLEKSDSLHLTVEPATAQLAPQQQRQNSIRLKPRKRLWLGEAKRMPMTVTVTSRLQTATATPTYIQLPILPRWLPLLVGLLCCVLIPVLALVAWPIIKAEIDARATAAAQTAVAPTLAFEATLTAQPTATPTLDLAATATAAWCADDADRDNLTNCEELELDTEVDLQDSDTDGLSDYLEVKQYNTDPLDEDSDSDTLKDGEEVNEIRGCFTSPKEADTDGDGIKDNVDPEPCLSPTETPALTPTATPVPDFALGGHVRGMDHLDVADDARMTWVKVQVRYSAGDNPASAGQDAALFKQEGFKVLLSVVGHANDIANGGSGYRQSFGDFVAGLAGAADAIEVWNEPNIQDEWPIGQIDGAAYTELLRVAYNTIKAKNQSTLVISAAPAPTGYFGGGCRAEGCDDDVFIRAMAAAGARNYMDCIGVHYNAGATSPGDTSGHPAATNHHSWYFLPTLELYWNTFNPPGTAVSDQLPLCFTEVGYLTDDGFDLTLAQVGATSFSWAEGTSDRDQAAWLEEALLRACRSGKVKLFIVWNVDFTEYSSDPQAGYAILRPDEDCPACETLSRAVGILRNEGCMRG